MIQEEEALFCAWVDNKRRIVSFHEIPGSRLFCESERVFWENIVALVLSGYRVQ